MASALYNESFVLYESVFRTYQRIYKKDKARAADYINAVMEFGIDGVIPDEDDEVWFYGLDNAIASISAAKDRRAKNIEDGAKGGRKSERAKGFDDGFHFASLLSIRTESSEMVIPDSKDPGNAHPRFM